MTQLPNVNPQGRPPNVPVPPPQLRPPRPQRWRFRWEIVAVILALMVGLWLVRGIEPSFEWREVMEALRVPGRDRERYTQLAVLGLALIGVVFVYRIFRSK